MADHQKGLTRPSSRCKCPTCTVSQALRDLDAATNAWMERDEETEMALAFLRDEVSVVVRDPETPKAIRLRLAEALGLSETLHIDGDVR